MSFPRRIFDRAFHNGMNRGNDGELNFGADQNKVFFLALLINI
jgi:hypothetical protein